jgi:hypothetical protein
MGNIDLQKIARGHKVQKGQELRGGVRTSNRENPWLSMLTQNECEALRKLVLNKCLKNLRMFVIRHKEEPQELKDVKTIASILELLANKSGDERYVSGGEALSGILEITLEATVNSEGLLRTIRLDDNGWERFQGKGDSNGGFAESPEYIFVIEKAIVRLKNELLRVVSLHDTPGLNSATDYHDETAEHHLQQTRGTVVVLIKLDIRQVDQGAFDRFLTLLRSVSRRGRVDRIVFFCNLWKGLGSQGATNTQSIRKMMTRVERTCKEALPKSEIYLCDLRAAIVDGDRKETEYGYQSYLSFVKTIRRSISEVMDRNLDSIRQSWTQALTNETSNAQQRLKRLRAGQKEKQERLERLSAAARAIAAVDVNTSYRLRHLEGLLAGWNSAVSLLTSKKNWRNHGDTLVASVASINAELNVGCLFSQFASASRDIQSKLHGLELRITVPSYPQSGLTLFPENALASRINQVIASAPWVDVFYWYAKDEQSKMSSWLGQKQSDVRDSIKSHLRDCERIFHQFRKQAIEVIAAELNQLRDKEAAALEQCEADLDVLTNGCMPRWKEIEALIKKSSEGQYHERK